jgi:hypothetical protein
MGPPSADNVRRTSFRKLMGLCVALGAAQDVLFSP